MAGRVVGISKTTGIANVTAKTPIHIILPPIDAIVFVGSEVVGATWRVDPWFTISVFPCAPHTIRHVIPLIVTIDLPVWPINMAPIINATIFHLPSLGTRNTFEQSSHLIVAIGAVELIHYQVL